jgi:hypothetical protein
MTTVLSPFVLAHLVQVVRHKDCGFRAECACGWAGDWYDDQTEAELSAVEHREVAVGQATGLDLAVSGLLDLQDDLADVVMWLAENWSADLPTPHVFGRNHTRSGSPVEVGVALLVWCTTSLEFGRVARLLDTTVVADVEPNGHGSRWERTTRRFGRVHINAYRSLDDDKEPGCDAVL